MGRVIRDSSVMDTQVVILVTCAPMDHTHVMRMHSAPKLAREDSSVRCVIMVPLLALIYTIQTDYYRNRLQGMTFCNKLFAMIPNKFSQCEALDYSPSL